MINNLAIYEKSLSIGSLGAYIHWTNEIPMLTAEEELELAIQLKEKNDLESARKLILSHLRAVVKIARGYSGYGLQQADLIQEGNIGLMKAVRRFDHTQGVRLISYAMHWIRAEIHEFVIKNWRIVKVATTKAQRKLFFNLRRMAKSSNTINESEAKIIAEELNVSYAEVRTMEQRLNNFDQAFDTPTIHSEDSEEWGAPCAYLEDKQANPAQLLEEETWEISQKRALYEALKTLNSREQDILSARWLTDHKATLSELAEKHGVSVERIRQLEKNALTKLKNHMQQAEH